ncbi:predicted glycosyltransferase [Chthonomonas calidirosea]|uniref:glycosyltransferase n=1 Tax=Chthonomonas calidirosea TaxID=454171 RepID=UPI0006DD3BB1|nr:glycosyltransferase [Chthonomonas calidirosea]CEK19141.1 predicted glycosyltransferase [Chthonomonas calidirosea]
MRIPNLTFVVFTYNEEARLPLVIRNFRSYGRILVVDNYSTDRTRDIAKEQGCDVLLNRNEGGFMENQETCDNVQSAVRTDWMFWLAADELVAADALEELERLIRSERYDVICMVRKNYFQGAFCHDIAIGYRARAFKKNTIDFRNNKIHEFGRIVAPKERVYYMPSRYFVHHLISNTAATYLETIQRYTEIEKKVRAPEELDRPLPYLLLLPFKALWSDYLLKGGIRGGRQAVHLSALMMIYSLLKAIKGYEAKMGLTADEIAKRNRQIAEMILQTIPSAEIASPTDGRQETFSPQNTP